ncbi:hypothetical protein CAPTEDRAFT_228783 [Capitella teleta]|uniref:MADF domain-containing protein n=1 Tax=Capitella teleta TaxID=283909 RepID=R7T6I8_CAPTE|nr:hypothetical protein CAPTEDRAFT_228783 [Capitella teleta]|eukprot:ELT89105.1 hypothetical protein CAPTEDRAFT_228783 [Capitella teleta]
MSDGASQTRGYLSTEKAAEMLCLIRQNPFLYNPELPGYRDHALITETWRKIAAQLNVTGLTGYILKSKWRNRKDDYRKRMLRSLGGGKMMKSHSKTSELDRLMQFMNPFIFPESQTQDELSSLPDSPGDVGLLPTQAQSAEPDFASVTPIALHRVMPVNFPPVTTQNLNHVTPMTSQSLGQLCQLSETSDDATIAANSQKNGSQLFYSMIESKARLLKPRTQCWLEDKVFAALREAEDIDRSSAPSGVDQKPVFALLNEDD